MPAVLGAAGPGQQGVDEGVGGMAGSRMDDETRRLVDDEQVVVLVHHADRDVRGRGQVERRRWRDVEMELGPGRDDRVRPERHAVRGQPAVGDELLDVAPGQPGGIRDEPVDPTGRAVGHPQRPGPAAVAPSGIRRGTEPGREAREEGQPDQQHDRGADRGVGDVERPEADIAESDVDPVDDEAEPEPIDEVADRAAQEQARARPRGTGCARNGRGTPRSGRRRRARRSRTGAPGHGRGRTARPSCGRRRAERSRR